MQRRWTAIAQSFAGDMPRLKVRINLLQHVGISGDSTRRSVFQTQFDGNTTSAVVAAMRVGTPRAGAVQLPVVRRRDVAGDALHLVALLRLVVRLVPDAVALAAGEHLAVAIVGTAARPVALALGALRHRAGVQRGFEAAVAAVHATVQHRLAGVLEAMMAVHALFVVERVHAAGQDPILDGGNLMYTMHFYAATHKDDLRQQMVSAHQNGMPIFISEFSIVDASGNGAIDNDSAEKWKDAINDLNISYAAWSLCNKDESSALLKPSASADSWTEDDLSDAGIWIRNMIQGK